MKKIISDANGISTAELIFAGDFIEIDMIETPEEFRGCGMASKLLDRIIETFGNSYDIRLIPISQHDSSMPTQQLKNWYQRKGFVDVGSCSDLMIREKSRS